MLDDRRMAGRLARDFRVFLRQARRDESFYDLQRRIDRPFPHAHAREPTGQILFTDYSFFEDKQLIAKATATVLKGEG